MSEKSFRRSESSRKGFSTPVSAAISGTHNNAGLDKEKYRNKQEKHKHDLGDKKRLDFGELERNYATVQ